MAFDEQDDLSKWLQSQDSPNLAPATPAAAAGPGVWSKARELMDKQSAMQYAPQDYSKYLGQKEEAPSRTGNDFRTILAMALDLFGNKGRGAGQLMQAGNQTFDAKEAAWKRENGPQAQLARQMQVKQLEGADRAAFNQDRSTIAQQAGAEMQMAGAQAQDARDTRNFEHTQERDMAGDIQHQLDQSQSADQFATGQKTTHEQMAQNALLQREQMRASNANSAAQRAQADAHFKAQQEQHLLDQDNQLDRDRDNYGQQRKMQELQNQGQVDKYQIEHPAPVLPQGYTASNPQLFSQTARTPGMLKEATDAMQTYNKGSAALKTLERLQEAPSSSANKRVYDAAIKDLIGDKSKEGSTGALTGTEFERYISDLPEYGEHIGPGWRGKVDAFQGVTNSGATALKQIRAQYGKAHANSMSVYGIAPSDFSQPEPTDQAPSLVSRYPKLKLVE